MHLSVCTNSKTGSFDVLGVEALCTILKVFFTIHSFNLGISGPRCHCFTNQELTLELVGALILVSRLEINFLNILFPLKLH